MTHPCRVALLDDHPVLLQGLHKLLGELGFDIVIEATTPDELRQRLRQTPCNLLILDISLGKHDGMPLIREIAAQTNPIPVLVYSMHEEHLFIKRALNNGARGYISKRAASETIARGIDAVTAGKIFLCEFSTKVLQDNESGEQPTPAVQQLTARERKVLGLISQGYTSAEIAGQLHNSIKTIETHISRIKEKLDFLSTGELRRFAISQAQSGMSFQ